MVESEYTEKSRKGREVVIQQVTADSKGLRWHFAWAIHNGSDAWVATPFATAAEPCPVIVRKENSY